MSHSYINNHLHVVYSTKDRKDLIPAKFEPRLYSFIAEIGREQGVPVIAAGGMPNHSHLLILLPATLCLADVVNTLKTNSSRFMSQQGMEFRMAEGVCGIRCLHVACRTGESIYSQSKGASQETNI